VQFCYNSPPVKTKQRHLNFLNEQKINHATILLTGMPELQARPLGQQIGETLARVGAVLRFVLEALLTEVAFVAPWLFRVARAGSANAKQGLKRGYAVFPREFWLSLLLIAGTGLILTW